MSEKIELKKSSMAFKLENGEVLLISQEDVSEIATQLVCKMMTEQTNRVYITRSSAMERCNLLYKAVTEQKGVMNRDLKQQYLKQILDLIDGDGIKTTTLEDDIKNMQKVH